MWNNRSTGWRVSINIDAKNGVYILGGSSADGKTWLCNEIDDMGTYFHNTVGYSYKDYLDNLDLRTKIKNKCGDKIPEVVVIDRYDMYCGVYWDYIKELGKHSIVIVDCKVDDDLDLRGVEYGGIYIEQNRIEVIG